MENHRGGGGKYDLSAGREKEMLGWNSGLVGETGGGGTAARIPEKLLSLSQPSHDLTLRKQRNASSVGVCFRVAAELFRNHYWVGKAYVCSRLVHVYDHVDADGSFPVLDPN